MSAHDLRLEAMAAQHLLAELRAQDEALSEEDALCAVASETSLEEAARATVRAIDLDEAHVAALAEIIAKLEGRKSRLSVRAQRRKDALMAALDLAGLRSMPLPEATLVVLAGKPGVRITDEAAIPAAFRKTKITEAVDKAALAAALKTGETIPGAELSNGAPCLSLRRK